MSERDRGMAIAMLAEAFHVTDLSVARIKIYAKALEAVPVALLEPMVQRAIATRKPRWGDLPTVAELREDAETCRRELLTALQFEPCAVNEGCSQHGFVEREINGVKRMVRCRCWTEIQARREALGTGNQPLALPVAE